MAKEEELKKHILELTREYYNKLHAPKKEFVPGKSFVNYGGRYIRLKRNLLLSYLTTSLLASSLRCLNTIRASATD